MLAREAWKAACEFRRESNPEVLNAVESAVLREPKPVVLLDLDHTLYRNALRTRAILLSLLPGLRDRLPDRAHQLLAGIEEERMGFSLRDTFRLNGLFPEDPQWADTLLLLRQTWWPEFFSSRFLAHDVPYPGAPQYCRRLTEAGARLIYLSARDGKSMREGTLANLKRDGFPLRGSEDVWLKVGELSDGAYKAQAVSRCAALGSVVASFENEPANTVELRRELPDALHVFVDTVCSEVPAIPLRGIFRLSKYL